MFDIALESLDNMYYAFINEEESAVILSKDVTIKIDNKKIVSIKLYGEKWPELKEIVKVLKMELPISIKFFEDYELEITTSCTNERNMR
jgi:hypothetical protein